MFFILLFFHGVKHISQTTFSTILTIKMGSHEDTSTAFFGGTFTSQSVNFAIVVDSVIFQHGEFDLLMLVLDFLGSSVILLLAFLTATSETEYQVKSGFWKRKMELIPTLKVRSLVGEERFRLRPTQFLGAKKSKTEKNLRAPHF